MPINTDPDLMTPEEVADVLRISRRALDKWRQEKPPRGPRWIKLGTACTSSIRYPRAAITEFLAEREAASNPQPRTRKVRR